MTGESLNDKKFCGLVALLNGGGGGLEEVGDWLTHLAPLLLPAVIKDTFMGQP